ncbi:hypothetical protein Tco_0745829, partial [Tanacetum coccineum]
EFHRINEDFVKRLRSTLEEEGINEDFVKRLRSTLEEEGDHYIEPTEFEIQEIVNIWVQISFGFWSKLGDLVLSKWREALG